jgi:hypothetical protein
MPISDAPSPLNSLLLSACLGDADALRAWEAAADIEAHDADMHALLPLLHHRAEAQGWSLKHAGRIAGVYRFWFARNQMTLRLLNGARAALANNGIGALVHGAAALMLDAPRIALCPAESGALLVRPSDQARAAAALQKAGWTAQGWTPRRRVPWSESLLFRRGDEHISLRWYALDWRCAPGADADMWARARTLPSADGACLPAPLDLLLMLAAQPLIVWGQPAPALRRALGHLLLTRLTPAEVDAAAAHYALHPHVRLLSGGQPGETDWFTRRDLALRGAAGHWHTHLIRWHFAVRGQPPAIRARRALGYAWRMIGASR